MFPRILKTVCLALLTLAVASCTAGPALRHVPELLSDKVAISGYGQIRYWGDDGASIESATIRTMLAQQARSMERKASRDFLVLSGGGSNGAFGAGILYGWSEAGTRPSFTVVTGVSTGSLIAPFAFLGSAYDDDLKASYTEVTGDDIYRKKGIVSALTGDAAADNGPLRKMVERYVNDTMLDEIAREHAKGRRLLVGTTNLDAERPVVWDIGAIASSGQPGRKKLVQDIIVASAAIPGIFSPVRIQVVAGGQSYDETHVDGGTSNQAFLFPSNLSLRDIDKAQGWKPKRNLYIIRNGKVTPEYKPIKSGLAAIVGRSVSTLIKTQGIGDLYRMYTTATREDIAFNAIWLPPTFDRKEPKPFDPGYMQALFDVGRQMGATGIP
ncbi:MAG: patatin-like phospholipase family protein, partial [Rhizobiales bacterium]|nr:patatin-like phospholipase family protein [Hyphomicrobiales bacterium]